MPLGSMVLGARLMGRQGTKGSAERRLPSVHTIMAARPPQDSAERPTIVRSSGTLTAQGGRQLLRLVPALHNVHKVTSR